MQPALGSLNTMTPAFDAKQKQNENAANDRKLRNPNTPAERFVMPGQQQVQAMVNARQQLGADQQPTFANLQKQGVARPAPPAGVQRGRDALSPDALQERLKRTLAQRPAQQPAAPGLSDQVQRQMYNTQMLPQNTQSISTADPQGLPPGAVPIAPQGGSVAVGGQQPVLTAQPPAPTLPQQVAQQLAQPAPAAAPAAPALPQQVAQAMGQAPAPQQVAPQQPAQPSATQSELQQRLLQQLTELGESPGAFGTEQIQQMRESQRADLEAQFGAQRQQLEEELARRGLSASSIAAGQFGDIAGQQARALASMEASLTEKAAESLQRGRESLIQGLGQAAGIEIQAKGLDLNSKKVQADIEAESKRLMQADRSLDLQQARDIAQQNIAYAQLAEQAAGRVSRDKLTIAQMNQQESQFARTLGLDEKRFQQDVADKARDFELRDRSLTETQAHNMAMEQLSRDQLDQRVAEAAATAERWGIEFTSQQEYQKWVQDWIMAQAEAAGAGSGDLPSLGGYGGMSNFGGGGGSNDYDLLEGAE